MFEETAMSSFAASEAERLSQLGSVHRASVVQILAFGRKTFEAASCYRSCPMLAIVCYVVPREAFSVVCELV